MLAPGRKIRVAHKLEQSSKDGSRPSSTSITWRLKRHANDQAPARPIESKALQVQPSICILRSPPCLRLTGLEQCLSTISVHRNHRSNLVNHGFCLGRGQTFCISKFWGDRMLLNGRPHFELQRG